VRDLAALSHPVPRALEVDWTVTTVLPLRSPPCMHGNSRVPEKRVPSVRLRGRPARGESTLFCVASAIGLRKRGHSSYFFRADGVTRPLGSAYGKAPRPR
jgi:hypothetical protein